MFLGNEKPATRFQETLGADILSDINVEYKCHILMSPIRCNQNVSWKREARDAFPRNTRCRFIVRYKCRIQMSYINGRVFVIRKTCLLRFTEKHVLVAFVS